MRKILYFITQAEFGGAQRYVFDLASSLSGKFETAAAMGPSAADGQLIKKLRQRGIKYFIIPHLKRSLSPFNDLLAFFEIIKLIKNFRPDIIHLNSSKISILGSLAGAFTKLKIKNLKIIYTVHGWVFNEPLPWLTKLFYRLAEKFTARFKDIIICVSEFDRQAALKHKIAPIKKLVTIHNGLAFRHPGPDPGSGVYRRELISGLRIKSAMTNSIVIGSIGHLYKTKGYEYFIEAARILMADPSFPRRQESRFIIIGEGNERNYLENLIAKYNLQNNFILTGQINEAASRLKTFDIYVCSSVKEGLPYSILEAMQAGLPIVSANVGGIPEMIEHKKTGLLVKPVDPKNLAEKIKTLLNNKTLAQELGRRAQAKAATEFSLEKMVKATKKIYK